MKYILILISIFYLVAEGIAQNSIISGYIYDKISGEPIPFANVFLKNNITKGTVSDINGQFNLSISNDNKADTLIISFIGYKEKHIPVVNTISGSVTINLQPHSKMVEETIIKTRKIISEEFTIEKIEQIDIYLNPLSKADPLLAVNGLASSTTLDESANISLRGSSPAETGVFFNDVPIYDAVRFSQINGIGTFSIFNTAIVDQMHVFPGNPPIEYGNSTSGLVSIHSSDQIPINNYHSIIASLASFGVYSSAKLKENTGLTFFTNYQPSKLLIELNKKAMIDLKGFNSTDVGIHYTHNFDHKKSFKIFNYFNSEGFEYYFRHPSYNGMFEQNKKRDFLVSNFTRKSANSELSLNGGFSYSNENYDHGNTSINLDKIDLFLSANYYYFLDKLSIKGGISLDNRIQKLDGKFPIFEYAISKNHPSINVNYDENLPVYEGYTYIKYNINSQFTFGFGARKNIPVSNQDNYISYQGNLNYRFGGIHSLQLSGGKYNKYSLPNAEIQGIYFISSNQASIDYELQSEFINVSSAIFMKLTDIENRKQEIYGGELFAKISLTNKLEAQASYTYLDAKLISNELEYPSKYDLDFFIRGSLSYNFSNNINVSAIYLSRQGQYYTPVISANINDEFGIFEPNYSSIPNAAKLPYYSRFDISSSKLSTISDNKSLIVFINVSNILNKKNVRHINYSKDYSERFDEYFSLRSVYFGIILNFLN